MKRESIYHQKVRLPPQKSGIFPALGNVHIRPIQGCDGWATQQPESTIKIGPQDLNRSHHSSFPRRSQAIGVSASAQNRVCPQANCFDDVSAAPNATVHQNLDLTVYCFDNLRQGS